MAAASSSEATVSGARFSGKTFMSRLRKREYGSIGSEIIAPTAHHA
jgi:hypothetical protein